MQSEPSCISRGILENEFVKFMDNPRRPAAQFTDRDRRMVSTYRSFVRFNIIKQKRELIIEDFIFTTLAKYLCSSPKISYEEFRVIAGVAPPSAHKYFTAQCFLKFPRDENQCIDSEDLVKYIERSMEIETATLDLMDTIPPGFDPLLTCVTEQQIEAFIIKRIPEIDIFQRMHESFTDFYAYTASQKFMFFQDQRGGNSISIKKLAHSKEMNELVSIRRLALQIANGTMSVQEAESELSKNWFSYNNAERLYNLFLELDKDQNGVLSIDEVGDFAGINRRKRINFTRAAWSRIFEEYVPYSPPELDYKGFVRLVLALENPTTAASIRYFWKLLDFDQSGRLTPMKINYFYRDIYASLISGYDAPSAAHVVVEVFDLLGCNSAEGATLEDFIASKQGHVVAAMLLDVNGFWRYDNRESLMGSEEEEEAAEAQVEAAITSAHAADVLDALLEGDASLVETSPPKRKLAPLQTVVGSVVLDDDVEGAEETSSHAKSRAPVSVDAKSRLLSQIGVGGDDDYDDSFDEYDDDFQQLDED